MNNLYSCKTCKSQEITKIDSYKRFWILCNSCGDGWSIQKKQYPLSLFPINDLRKQSGMNEEKMYDYFTDKVHIDISVEEGKEFIRTYMKDFKLNYKDKEILDISGGNGYFINEIRKLGAKVSLTEINEKTIEHAKLVHDFNIYNYNINKDNIQQILNKKFDIIFARACIMFCLDLNKFIRDLKKVLNKEGYIMINNSVIPTLGVILRTQVDEHSYFALRQPKTIIDAFLKNGFSLEFRKDETDQGLYVYDDDLIRIRKYLNKLYEMKGIKTLKSNRLFSWPARDRRRSTMLFRLNKNNEDN